MSLKQRIKCRLKDWLGLNDLEIELLSIKRRYGRMEKTWSNATAEIQDIPAGLGNTRIVVASNLGKGFARFYEIDFCDVRELMGFCDHLREQEVSSRTPIIDAPYGLQEDIQSERRKRRFR